MQRVVLELWSFEDSMSVGTLRILSVDFLVFQNEDVDGLKKPLLDFWSIKNRMPENVMVLGQL